MSDTEVKLHFRYMIRADMPSVTDIEDLSYKDPWSANEFLKLIQKKNVIGIVVEIDGDVVAFVLYELHDSYLRILNLAVHPHYRRRGIGHAMMEKVKDKIRGVPRRDRLALFAPDWMLPAHLFFRSEGFLATGVIRAGNIVPGHCDLYRMEWVCPSRQQDIGVRPATQGEMEGMADRRAGDPQ